ncbi:MAG: glycoside hydrolase [Bacteroidetes bacterium HGW-Bacteroidetes-1]|jgi:beta-glucanase (GH16 family)|nr:MAG: glycoside hydrolase [Bacteroidetes bacterium HGW-Bacteroidetes-1]
MEFKRIFVLSILFSALGFLACNGNKEGEKPVIILPGPVQDQGWTFETTPFWADEFDYSGLPDQAKWGYDIGGGGWGNNELQYYTNELRNASVSDGILTITAIKENFDNRNYTSTRLITKNKGDLLYGRVEVKAKLPTGKGTWPAIWMLPTDWEYGGWPKSGEIDIMEHVGYDQNVIHVSTHCEAYYWRLNNHKTATKTIETASTEFHVYRIDWTPYAIRGYIDNQLVFTSLNEGTGPKAWPFDKRFHLLLNVAVGGDWGGQQGVDDSAFPASLEIDYVRFYKMMNP